MKTWIKKIADNAYYDEEIQALEILEKCLSYNSDRLENEITQAEKKDLDKKDKQLSRSLKRCKSNAEIIREKLEAIR